MKVDTFVFAHYEPTKPKLKLSFLSESVGETSQHHKELNFTLWGLLLAEGDIQGIELCRILCNKFNLMTLKESPIYWPLVRKRSFGAANLARPASNTIASREI